MARSGFVGCEHDVVLACTPCLTARATGHRLWPGGEVCVQCRSPWPCPAVSSPDPSAETMEDFHGSVGPDT